MVITLPNAINVVGGERRVSGVLAATAEDAAGLVETHVFCRASAQAREPSISTVAHPGEPIVLDMVSRIVPEQTLRDARAKLPSRC